MSLETFFNTPKKRETRKKSSKPAANEALANQDDEAEPELASEEVSESCTEHGKESASPNSDGTVVQQVTLNIEKMLDTKLANILKPVTEMSEKLDKLVDRLGTVEQRVSDLEDNAAGNAPRLESLESALKKAMGKLENYENQSRRQNVRIIGLKEGTEGKNPPVFFEKWIPEGLGHGHARGAAENRASSSCGTSSGIHRQTGPPCGPGEALRLHRQTENITRSAEQGQSNDGWSSSVFLPGLLCGDCKAEARICRRAQKASGSGDQICFCVSSCN